MNFFMPTTIIVFIGFIFYLMNKNPKLPVDLVSAFKQHPNLDQAISIGLTSALLAYSGSEYISNGKWLEFRKSNDGLILIPKGIFGIGKPENSIIVPWDKVEIADRSDSWGEHPGEILRLKGVMYDFDFWALENGYIDQIRSMITCKPN